MENLSNYLINVNAIRVKAVKFKAICRFLITIAICFAGNESFCADALKPLHPPRTRVLRKQSVLPSISYATPQVYAVGTPTAPLSPSSTGGAVGAYGAPTTFFSASNHSAITVDASGNVVAVNYTSNTLTTYNSAGTVITSNYPTSGYNGAQADIIDGAGNLYVSNYSANTVTKTTLGGVVTTLTVSTPLGLTVDASNNVYVASQSTGNIYKIATGTAALTTFLTGFNQPWGIAINSTGDLYVGQTSDNVIYKVSNGSTIHNSFATGFNSPRFLVLDPSGNLYVTDVYNNAVKQITPGGTVSTFVSGLSTPDNEVFDQSGNLYIANFNNSVAKYAASGYSVSPALPAGLNINKYSGVIYGTPTVISPAANYTVTATNVSGSSTAVVNIAVNPSAPSVAVSGSPGCGSGSVTLTASGGSPSGGVYNWYSSPTGGLVATGTVFSPITSGTFYLSYISGGTTSAQTSAAAVINPVVSSPYSGAALSYSFSGNTNDVSGNANTGLATGSPTLTTDRFGTANSAYSFNGSSQYISSTATVNSPNVFTLSLWFSTMTAGGKLIGFGAAQTGSSGSYDRQVYMNNLGQLYYGIYPGSVQTINTAGSYNDGSWHHVIVTTGPDGSTLYVDGTLQAYNASMTTGQNFSGYWRIGYDNTNGWTNQPTNYFFTGKLDDIAVYYSELSAAQISSSNNLNQAGPLAKVCAGTPVTFNAPSIAGATYTWHDSASGTQTGQNPIFPSAVAGNYTLTVTGGPGGCSSTATITPVINPLAVITYATPQTYIVGTAISSLAPAVSGGTPTGYAVTPALPAGLTMSTTTGIISGTATVAAAAANYTVTATTASGCTGTTAVNITVTPPAPAATGGSTCGTGTITLTASGGNPAGGTYNWYSLSSGGVALQSSTATTYTTASISATTTYYVSYTSSTVESSRTAATATVNPSPVITYATPQTYIAGTAISSLSPTVSGGTPTGYAVSPALPAGLTMSATTGSISGTPTVAAAAANYTVTATTASGCTGTAVINITVNPSSPSVAISGSPGCGSGSVTFTASGGSPSGGVYNWYGSPAGSIIATGTSFTPSTSGTYYVSYVSGGTTSAQTSATAVINPIVSSPYSGAAFSYSFSGNANDVSGNNNTGHLMYTSPSATNPTLSADRYSTANSAYTFDGQGQYIYTTTQYTNPQIYTLSLWFNTTTTSGGKLIGFDSNQAGPGSGQFDRHIYMNNSGQLYFGVYNSGTLTIFSPKSYNDGTWHHIVVTVGTSNGSVMYIDGSAVASNAAMTVSESNNGYWRIGGGALSGWPSTHTSNYFAGQIDDIGVYSSELSAGQVASANNLNLIGFTSSVCAGTPITFNAPTITGATYSWHDSGSGSQTGQNPTFPSAVAGNYTLTVTGGPGGCSSTATITPNINPVPVISYATPQTYTVGTAIINLSPTVSGGTPTGYAVSPALPAGLTMSTTTGTISGTPTAAAAPANFAITATTASGCTGTAVVNITVTPPAPAATGGSVCGSGTVTLTASGGNPAGGIYNWYAASSGGTALQSSTATSYTTASISATTTYYVSYTSSTVESTRTAVTATVNPLPVISYATPQNYTVGTAITSLPPTVSGGTPTGYTTSPALPAGLTLSTTTGTISGTPTAAAAAANYTVTATTASGCTGTAVVNITVTPPAPTATGGSVCGSGTVTLTASGGTPAGGTYNWYVLSSGGVASQSSTATSFTTPSISSTTAYYVSYTSGGVESNRTAVTATVNPLPASTFTATSPVAVSSSSTITYTGSDPASSTYNWNFNGGTIVSGSGRGPYAVQWSTSGNKSVTLSVTNASGCTSVVTTQTVVVQTVAPTATGGSSCGPGTVTLTASGTPAGGTYNWYVLSSGGVASQSSTATSFTTPSISTTTTYYVSYTSSGIESNRTAVTATVNPIPASTFTATSPVSVGGSSTITYTGSDPASSTYTWNFNGGTIVSGSGQGPYAIQWSTSGNKSVTLSVTNAIGCTSVVTTQTVVVQTVAPTATGGSTCGPGTVTLTASGTPAGGTYNWYVLSSGGVASQSSTATTFTTPSISSTTTYYVSYTSSGSESNRTAVTATINPVPVISYATPQTYTVGTAITNLLPTVSGGTPAGYAVNPALPAGLTMSTTTGIISGTPTVAAAAANYTVTATTASGCTGTAVVNITVNPSSPSVAVSGSPGCGSGSVTFTASGGSPAGGTYNWYGSLAGAIVATGTTFSPISSGTYYVSYVSGGNTSAQTSAAAVINPIVSSPYSGAAFSYSFSGNTNDVSGNANNGLATGGPTPATDRYGAANGAYSFNGSSQYLSTTAAVTSPAVFSISLWFNTTTGGGKLIGFGSNQTGGSTTYDRHLYMSASGQLYFGIYNGSFVTINTSASYNDGNWHHVVVTEGAAGVGTSLYVDGIMKASNTSLVPTATYAGYWRIGYDALSTSLYPTASSNPYFTGTLDDIAVYNRVLTNGEISYSNNLNQIGFTSSGCAGNTITLSAPAIAGATYSWTDGTTTVTGRNATFASQGTGSYTLTVTGSAGCSSSATFTPVTPTYTWTGSANTDPANANNWNYTTGSLPNTLPPFDGSASLIIPNGLTNYPVLTATESVFSLTIASGAKFSLGGYTLNVGCNIYNNCNVAGGGILYGSNNSSQISWNGSLPAQSYNGTTTAGTAQTGNMTVNNSAAGTVTIAGGGLDIYNTLTMVKGNLAVGVSPAALTLKSFAAQSASVAALPAGSAISGNVTVERFVTGGTAKDPSTGRWTYRNYRLMSSPVNEGIDGSGNFPYSLNYLAASTIITDETSTYGSTAGNPSLYLYNEGRTPSNATFTSGNFTGVTNISSTTAAGTISTTDPTYPTGKLYAGDGFMIYFRGDNINYLAGVPSKTKAPFVAPENVVFSTTGNLNQGTYSVTSWTGAAGLMYTTSNAGNAPVRGYNLVGNPYASSLDWSLFSNSNPGAAIYGKNVNPSIYIFNPVTNNYDTYSATTGIATGNASNVIPSGAGFYVQANGASPTLTFKEAAKTSAQVTGNNLLMGRPDHQTAYNSYMRLKLITDTANYNDMVIGFNSSSTMKYNPAEDAEYLNGFNAAETLAGITADSVKTSVKWLPLPKANEERTLPLNVTGRTSGIHKLAMTTLKQLPAIYEVWLMDKYKSDSLDIRHNSTYAFNLELTDTASYGSNRFRVVIRQDPALAIHLLNFTAAKASNGAQLVWKTENEQNYTNFTVERSTDNGKTFQVLGGLSSAGQGSYSFLDKDPQITVDQYRLKIEDLDGTISYSKVIPLMYSSLSNSIASSGITIYPNPATSNVNLYIVNTAATSANNNVTYNITVVNSTGTIIKTDVSSKPTWQYSVGSLIPGTYMIQVVNNNDKSLVGKGKFIKL